MVNADRISDVIGRVKSAIAQGQRIYWICPLVEETDKLDISAAEDRHRQLVALLPEANAQLAHGKMKSDERQIAMQAFKDGVSQLLVATTVIEVGGMPEAGIMIIEHAELWPVCAHSRVGVLGAGKTKQPAFCCIKAPYLRQQLQGLYNA